MVVVGLIVEELANINLKCVKYRSRYLPSQYNEVKHYARFSGCRSYIWGNIEHQHKMCQSHWSAKYRSRSPGQGTCRVSISRRSTIQGLVVESCTVEDIRKGDVKGVKVNGAQNIGQGHRLKVPVESVHFARFGGCRPYSWKMCKMCKRHWSAKYRSRSPGQDICWVSTSRRSTMQSLVARGLTLEEIWNISLNYVKVTAAKTQVKVTRSRYLPSQYIEKKHSARFDGCRPYSWGDIEHWHKMCQSHWSAKYRSRSLGQGSCRVSTSRRSTIQGLVVVRLIVVKIWNVNVNCVKVTGAWNIGQVHWVNVPAKSGGQGDVSCKVWWLL